jgi:pimeloyl-[acyl-carrier protein] methyl ester esterase
MLNLKSDPRSFLSEFVSLQLQNQTLSYQNQAESNALEAGLEVLEQWDLREPLRQFNKPTSYLFGRLDAITPARTMIRMKKIFPHFDYQLFDKAAHMPFLSHQDEFIRVLEQILK